MSSAFRSRFLIVLSLAAACGAHSRGRGAAPPPAPAQVAAVGSDSEQGSLRWIGGPTARIERAGLSVLTDPMLGPRAEQAFVLPKHPSSGVPNAPIARYTQPPPLDFADLTAILISHTHADHFDAHARQLLPKQLPVVVAKAGAESVRAAGFTDVRPLDWGETLMLTRAGTSLRVTAVAAHHAHDAGLDHDLGRGNGYVLEWQSAAGSYRVYWTGDAVLSDETKTLAAELGPIDLLLPHMGGVGGDGGLGLRTMNAVEALELTRRVDPRLVIPIHHTTFAHYREPIEALAQRVEESGEGRRFRFLREGESSPLSVVTAR
jgi:L-ascorbate metabolism protein UlaG (beta-lactamase superfamily)